MTEEAGCDIDGKIGRVIEVDKRSWQADQAKFMHVRVDLPIDKPLRKGGYVTNMDGERCWVTFKYERLPTFYFTCGKIGHDEKHYGMVIEKQPLERQYGEWMRAGVSLKGTNEGSKAFGSSSHEQRSGGEFGKKFQATVGEMVVFVQDDNGGSGSLGEQVKLERRENFEKWRHYAKSDLDATSNQSGWDIFGFEKQELSKEKGSSTSQKVTKGCLVKELFKSNEDKLSSVGWSIKPNKEEKEVTSPLKPKLSMENKESGDVQVGPNKGKGGVSKVNLKKFAREIGKAQGADMKTQEILVGTKRREDTEMLVENEGRLQKKSCAMVKVRNKR